MTGKEREKPAGPAGVVEPKADVGCETDISSLFTIHGQRPQAGIRVEMTRFFIWINAII